ncbi:hypothetical protein SS50377_23867 [Spironucleus salmonicida]|uniref:Transmembrane protein n=1 Tax=Spironucleus salmonicida TaxID=348837 RepID=A0A9P8RYH2_9EUKA|nr:hypothetical protein SS50377_23867 [Spironucleus salmonicida]
MKFASLLVFAAAPLALAAQMTVICSVVRLMPGCPAPVDAWVALLRAHGAYRPTVLLGYAANLAAVVHALLLAVLWGLERLARAHRRCRLPAYLLTLSLCLSLVQAEFRTVPDLLVVVLNERLLALLRAAARQLGGIAVAGRLLLQQVGAEVLDAE